MKQILIACEESQRVTEAFRILGYEAFSCDLMKTSGGHKEWHIQGDVIPLLGKNVTFTTMDGTEHHVEKWDAILAFPPCTYLTISGNRYFNEERYGDKARERKRLRDEAAEFFMQFVNADCEHIAIENPVGAMNTRYRKPDQVIQPYQFGHPVKKKTCLWLKNLPLLSPTNIVEVETQGKNGEYSGNLWYCRNENGVSLRYNDPKVKLMRSKTYEGIATAMAEQWSQSL